VHQHAVGGGSLAAVAGDGIDVKGRLANLRLASRVFGRGLLARIACAKDLVGGAEDALSRALGECLALAP